MTVTVIALASATKDGRKNLMYEIPLLVKSISLIAIIMIVIRLLIERIVKHTMISQGILH